MPKPNLGGFGWSTSALLLLLLGSGTFIALRLGVTITNTAPEP